jgi:hypothetical protein
VASNSDLQAAINVRHLFCRGYLHNALLSLPNQALLLEKEMETVAAALAQFGNESLPIVDSHLEPVPFVYKSKFINWDESASVRSQPRRIFKGEDRNKLFFSPEVVPIASHPLVIHRGLAGEMLLHHAIHHLCFTSQLEHTLVNHVTYHLANHRELPDIPAEMRFDAYKIFCDEAYHALFSVDLVRQLECELQLQTPAPSRFPFIERINRLKETIPSAYHLYFEILAAIVSETLISSTLGVVPRDTRVVQAVRETIRDHAVDEGLHHAYFSQLLQVFWPRLPQDAQRTLGQTLPELIEAFLVPDTTSNHETLCRLGLSRSEATRVIEESYPTNEINDSMLAASRATRSLFTRHGVLSMPEIYDAFAKRGMLFHAF